MILQSVVIPDNVCDEERLYFRVTGKISYSDGYISLAPGVVVTTDTYFNLFDAGTWNRYTGGIEWNAHVVYAGQVKIQLIKKDEIYYLRFENEGSSDTVIYYAGFETPDDNSGELIKWDDDERYPTGADHLYISQTEALT